MTDNKEKDVRTDAEAEEIVEEEAITDEAATDEAMTDEIVTDEIVIEDVIEENTIEEEMSPKIEGKKKPGRIRGFFKTRKLAIGITVLAVLLVANVAAFGVNKHMNKGFRDHGGKTIVREYTKGPMNESGVKAPRAEGKGEMHAEKAPKSEGGSHKEDESRAEKGMNEKGETRVDKGSGEKSEAGVAKGACR